MLIMFDNHTDESLLELRDDYKKSFFDDSPWNINRNHFFQCLKSVEEELTKRGVLMNEED